MKRDYKKGDTIKCVKQPKFVSNINLVGQIGTVMSNDDDGEDLPLNVWFSPEFHGDWFLNYEDAEPVLTTPIKD